MAREFEYSADAITVLTLAESVRGRPAMWFGTAASDPDFPAAVVCLVLDGLLARDDAATANVVIETDHRFTATNDVPPARVDPATDTSSGWFGSLLAQDRWQFAAAAAVCRRTEIELRTVAGTWAQDLDRTTPTGPPRRGAPAARPGTWLAFDIDADILAPGATLSADPTTRLPDGGGMVTVTDLRRPAR